MRTPSNRTGRVVLVLAVVVGWIAGAGVVWKTSYAAFSSTTTNGPNTLSAGTVALTNDSAASVLFNSSGVKPGSTGTTCLNVTYSGTLNTAGVRLYATSVTGTLGTYITFVIDEGTGATGGVGESCTGFVLGTNLLNSTIATFASTNTNFATGLSSWAPTSVGGTKSYRVTWTVQNNNLAQGLSCGITLTWEAQNS